MSEPGVKSDRSENGGGYYAAHRKSPGHCMWQWSADKAEWSPIEDRSEPGGKPGPGPTQQGRFEGQVVRWASVPTDDETDL